MVTAHWIRHGQTEWNRAGRVQGQTDSPLSERGREQAEATAELLRGRTMQALYSSDLGRAEHTAKILGATLQLLPRLDRRLREMSYGILEGMTWNEAEQAHPEVYRTLRGGGPDVRVPSGESRLDLVERALDFLSDIARWHRADEEVVIVSHGGVIAYLLRAILRIPYDVKPGFRTLNCGISTFVHQNSEWKLQTWGRVDHLQGLLDP